MYQKISITVFLITLAALAFDSIISRGGKCWKHPVKNLVHVFTLLFIQQKSSFVGLIKKLVYLLSLLCFVVLAITGFYPTLILGENISGYLIMIHATFAPVFAVCLAVLAVMTAREYRFTGGDWPWLERFIERVTLVKKNEYETKIRKFIGEKITFWIIIILALPLILSIVVSMLPFFGTYWQELFLILHRYSALVFGVAVIVHIYLSIRPHMVK